MNIMTPKYSQPDPFINMDDSSLTPQIPVVPTVAKKYQSRTSLTPTQHEELEALFGHTMFPDKTLQKDFALKLNLSESTVKIWFRNRRFKLKKHQQQQLKLSNQILPSRNVPSAPRASARVHSAFPAIPDAYSSFPPEHLGPSSWTRYSLITESPTQDVEMQEPVFERLVASVPALFPEAYDIAQIVKLYSFPDEEITSSSFQCLYQYLSPTRPQLEDQVAAPGASLSAGQSWSGRVSQGFAAYGLRDILQY